LGTRILAENCGTYEKVLKDFDRDYWMDAKEAVEYGIVDKISERLS
jgi:ATP-dependent Clp protease protease subunit